MQTAPCGFNESFRGLSLAIKAYHVDFIFIFVKAADQFINLLFSPAGQTGKAIGQKHNTFFK